VRWADLTSVSLIIPTEGSTYGDASSTRPFPFHTPSRQSY